MNRLIILSLVIMLCGCNANRSISYYGGGYNNSYTGELSQIEFLKDVSGSKGGQVATEWKMSPSSCVLIVQSGQMLPDAELMDSLPKTLNKIMVSGIPMLGGSTNGTGTSLRAAAESGNVDYILGCWGNIRNTRDDKISIIISAILTNVKEGTWKYYEVSTPPVDAAYSFFDPRGADDAQVQQLKEEVYKTLAGKLMGG